MPLPELNANGDLPVGIYPASLVEVVVHFGNGSNQRQIVTERLRRIVQLVQAVGAVDRLIIFGSYVSNAIEPKDVDVILVMNDQFNPRECPDDARVLFDHQRANDELGASVFWIRPNMLIGIELGEFIDGWQDKRDGARRGIVEVLL